MPARLDFSLLFSPDQPAPAAVFYGGKVAQNTETNLNREQCENCCSSSWWRSAMIHGLRSWSLDRSVGNRSGPKANFTDRRARVIDTS